MYTVMHAYYQAMPWKVPDSHIEELCLHATPLGEYDTLMRWQLITADPERVGNQLMRRGIAYDIIGHAEPLPENPPLRWANLEAACTDLSARYGQFWEGSWTEEEAAEFYWLRHSHTKPAVFQKNGIAVLTMAWQQYQDRHHMRDECRRDDAHHLAIYNLVRRRMGLYPVDGNLNVLVNIQAIECAR